MTAPNQVLSGRTVMVTVRAVHRLFLFAPSDTVNELVEYLAAYAAEQHGVGLVSMCWLSNHAHLVVNDHLGVVPDFVQTLNMLLARALNALRGDHGSVFERGNVDYKTLEGAGAAVTAIAYVAANPVAAGCVEYGREWPGVRSHIKDMGGREREVRRPDCFFLHHTMGYRGRLPAVATLRFELPIGVSDRGAFIHEAEQALGSAEAEARDRRYASGRPFHGAARCRAVSPYAQARTWEPAGPGTGPDPILCIDPAAKEEAEAKLAAFHDAYAAALGRWQAGDHAVEFPLGTWQLQRHHGARVVGMPRPDQA